MADMLNNMFKTFGDAQIFLNQPGELAAIWLDKSIFTNTGKTARLCAGMGVKVENGKLVDLPEGETPTHKILRCRGAQTHSHELDLLNFITGEPETIKI